ncbi:hypothetical protein H8D04_01310 [bacterium]|nr:hypothetical protein [bacterium]
MTKYTKTLDKLQVLIALVEETESEETSDNELFEQHKIDAYGMMSTIRDFHTGRKNVDADTERETLIATMKSANKIWKIRNRIKNGENINYLKLIEEIEDFVAQGSKINAIKHYRNVMDKDYDEKIGLREAKDFVDGIQDDMSRRGMII